MKYKNLSLMLFPFAIACASFAIGCAQKFNIQPGRAPIIAHVASNGPLVISGNYFDSLNSVVHVGGSELAGFTFERVPDSTAPEILFFQSFTPTASTNNPADITVTANGQVSNIYPFLFYPQVNSVQPDTAMSSRALAVNGLFFGNRTAASSLRAYFFDGNHRKTYMAPDPTINSWDGTAVHLTIPNYNAYKFGANIITCYFELAVSTDTTRAQLLYQ